MLYAEVSNPAAPRELAKVRYPQAGTHSAWPTEDEKFILTTDEISLARNNLKIWDARTPGQLTPVAEFAPPGVDPQSPSSIIHNVYVRGRYAYISYYCEGLRIVDLADPSRPEQVAFYDFNGKASCEYYNSNWGVDPFSNLIYASDMQNGLYVLEFDDHPAANLTGKVINAATGAPVAGAMVYFRDEYPSTRTNTAGKLDIPWFKNDTVKVVTEAPGYLPDTTIVITRAATPTPVTIHLNGAPQLTIANTVIDDDQMGASFGNGNGLIDGVETYELRLSLHNSGFATLVSGKVLLQSSDPYVKIIDSLQTTVGAVPAGQTAALNGPLIFTVSPVTPPGHELPFKLITTLNNQITEEILFRLPVNPPAIANFRANSTANSVTLKWRPVSDGDLNGYHIYRKGTLQADAAFVKLTTPPIQDSSYTITGLSSGQALTFAITKTVRNVESLAGARYQIVVRDGTPRILVVNGIDWTVTGYRPQMNQMYAQFPFNAGYIFDTWDFFGASQTFPEGYAIIGQNSQLTFEDLNRYELVVWLGNSFGIDLDAWYASLPALKKYLDSGGRLILITRLLYLFLEDEVFLQNYLRVSRSQIQTALAPVIQQIVPLQSDLVVMNATANNSASSGFLNLTATALVEPLFYLNNDRNTIMGLRARQKTDGPYNLVVIGGRPYRYDPISLKTNMTTIINKYFGLITAVDERKTAPENFALFPAYPNPFVTADIRSAVAATQIVFSLPQREKVRLEIFNVLGQRVRELLHAPREAGTHAISWDGANDAGQRVAAGVYIVRLNAGKFVAEKKMTLVR